MKLSAAFQSRSLLFLSLTFVRVAGGVFILLLIAAEAASLVNNLRHFGTASKRTTNTTQLSSDSFFTSSGHLLSTVTVIVGTSSSVDRSRRTSIPSSRAPISSLIAAASPTPWYVASTLVQPDKAAQASLSKAAAAQASALAHGVAPDFARLGQQLAHKDPSEARVDNDASHCGFVAGTSIPKTAGAVAFFVISKFINLVVLFLLLLSEFAAPPVARFFDRHVPILGSNHGLGWLGMLQLWISSNLLTQSQEGFQTVAAWMNFVLGCIHVVLGVTLQKSLRETRALVPTHPATSKKAPSARWTSSRAGSDKDSELSTRRVQISAPMPARLPLYKV